MSWFAGKYNASIGLTHRWLGWTVDIQSAGLWSGSGNKITLVDVRKRSRYWLIKNKKALQVIGTARLSTLAENKYVVSEHFGDMLSINIFVTCQVC